MAKYAVIIPAAGQSERFGEGQSKIFAKLDGRAVFLRTLELFINRDDVCQTILVVAPTHMDEMKQRYGANLGFMGVALAEGGEMRMESVRRALDSVKDDVEFIAVHDAVRPCATAAMIDAVFAEAVKAKAAILASPLTGTLKRVAGSGFIEATVSRANLYEAQTPQVFEAALLREAYTQDTPEGEVITDDAQLVELLGRPVSVVESDPTNLKITTKADIALANAILKARPAAKPVKPMGAFDEAQW